MQKKYPRFGIAKRYPEQSEKKCNACDEKAFFQIEVHTSYMRGEDDVFNVCQKHYELIKNNSYKEFYDDVKNTQLIRRRR
jgi:hypothetical protein